MKLTKKEIKVILAMRKSKMAKEAIYTYAVKFADNEIEEGGFVKKYREAYEEG